MKRDETQFEWRELAEEWRAKHTPPEGLEASLVSEFRRKHAVAVAKPIRDLRVWWMVAAAAMLVVFSGVIWNLRQPQKSPIAFVPPPVAQPVETLKPNPPQVAAMVSPLSIQAKPRYRTPKRQALSEPVIPATTAAKRETYTEFFPLEEGPISIDRGRVVRVRVPRSAMFNVGLPVNMNRWNDSVQADLVLSEEGIARAVRFVQ